MRTTGLIRGSIAAAALLLGLPAAAGAATRYASPTGSGPALTCPQSDPCDVQIAVESAAATDTVVILPGTYTLVDELSVPGNVTVTGDTSAAMPRLNADGTAAMVLSAGTARWLHLESNNFGGGSRAVDALSAAGTLERVEIVARGTTGIAIQLRNGPTIRDSFVWNADAASGTAVTIGGAGTSTMRNVTAIASGPTSFGVSAHENFGFPDPVTMGVNLRNVIARGTWQGIQAGDDGAADGDDVDVTVSNSNYSSLSEQPPEADVIDAGGNQTQAPLFAGAASGDFRQLPGSPTLNAGALDGLVGGLDIEGQPRVQGAGIDIGADEATDPNALLDLSNPEGRRKRTRTIDVQAICPLIRCGIAAAANLVLKGTAEARSSKVFKLENVSASLPAGQQGVLTFKLSRKLFKKLRRARKAKLNVAATAIDPVGFTGSEEIGIKFRKAKK